MSNRQVGADTKIGRPRGSGEAEELAIPVVESRLELGMVLDQGQHVGDVLGALGPPRRTIARGRELRVQQIADRQHPQGEPTNLMELGAIDRVVQGSSREATSQVPRGLFSPPGLPRQQTGAGTPGAERAAHLTTTLAPSRTRALGWTMTTSPGASPPSTSANDALRWSMSIVRRCATSPSTT